MDAAVLLARNMRTVKYEDLPQEAVEAVKRQFMDILGVALGGSSRPGVKELASLTREWGGKEESTIFCFGGKVPAPNAAQVNATMGHALDFDDTGEGPTHPSVVIFPTCLAVAERQGHCSGKDFITAAALGTDMMCRLGAAYRLGQKGLPAGGHPGGGWHLTAIYGYLAAAGVAGRLLGLTEDQMINALGIAYHQCAGNGQCVNEGSLSKRMGPGFSARGGIASALMAEKGITGAHNCLEGEQGLYNLYHQGKYDPRPLTAGLGKKFEGVHVGMKPYPCCKGSHSFADAALSLISQAEIDPGEISEITLYCEDETSFLVSPLNKRCRPENPVDAQFSIPWVVSAIIARKRASVGDFTAEAIRSPDILEVSGKIRVQKDPGMAPSEGGGSAGIEVRMTDGRTFSAEQEGGSLSAREVLPFSVYERKFRDCISYSIKPFTGEQIEYLISSIEQLEQVEDMGEIIRVIG